jgi:hypothetical protein
MVESTRRSRRIASGILDAFGTDAVGRGVSADGLGVVAFVRLVGNGFGFGPGVGM